MVAASPVGITFFSRMAIRASAKDKCSAVVADPLKLNGSSEHTMPAYSGKLVPTSAVQNEFAPTRYYHRVAYGE